MAAFSTAAWIAHDLGLATGLGGSIFGRMALHPAVRRITNEGERGAVVADAWKRFNWIQLGGLGLMGLSWLVGRKMLSGREIGRKAGRKAGRTIGRMPRGLVRAKDVLVIGTMATALGAAFTGRRTAAEAPGETVPLDEHGAVSPDATPRAQRLNKVTDALGFANLLAAAGAIAVTTMLAMRAGQSVRWSAISRLLR